jgi:hypothetical protein
LLEVEVNENVDSKKNQCGISGFLIEMAHELTYRVFHDFRA